MLAGAKVVLGRVHDEVALTELLSQLVLQCEMGMMGPIYRILLNYKVDVMSLVQWVSLCSPVVSPQKNSLHILFHRYIHTHTVIAIVFHETNFHIYVLTGGKLLPSSLFCFY